MLAGWLAGLLHCLLGGAGVGSSCMDVNLSMFENFWGASLSNTI